MRNQIEFLIDDADAELACVLGVLDFNCTVFPEYLAPVFLVGAAHDFHEGGFARPILAEKDMNFASSQIEIHAVESHDSRKCLSDAAHFDDEFVGHGLVLGQIYRVVLEQQGCALTMSSY